MKSKEALDRLPSIMLAKNIDVLDEISDCFNIIYKDLEILEILKKYLVAETMDNNEREWEQINCRLTLGKLPICEDEVAFNKVKEWLEDES